ncbi:MAG: 3'-5' exonuclease [Nanoarchaeota archaeon]
MIIVDIETSGNFDPSKNGIWQIGAVDFEKPENIFLEEARIDDEDNIEEAALKITGKTKEELIDKSKQSQRQLLENFFNWASKIKNRILVAHNTPFDYGFLILKAKKYNLEFPFSHRTFDLHVFAVAKYFEINKKLPIEDGKSKMNLSNVIEFCGLKVNRIQLKGNEVIKEGEPHDGLKDAKLEAECLSRILYGKNLIQQYKNFPIPDYLITIECFE